MFDPLAFLRSCFGPRPDSAVLGHWELVGAGNVPLPFRCYRLTLMRSGKIAFWSAIPAAGGGELEASGSGRYTAADGVLEYTLGESRGVARYSVEGDKLVLDRIPAARVGEGERCVFEPAPETIA